MTAPGRFLLIAALSSLSVPGAASAGMPAPYLSLSDVGQVRLQNISFFLAVFLLSALLIQLLWNYLGREWTALPRLNFGRAVGLVFIWGLAFVLVLTMISGARELMTPGAWERDGRTYKLTAARSGAEPAVPSDSERRSKLQTLHLALTLYARDHGGLFPMGRDDPGVQADVWETPFGGGVRYIYVPPSPGSDDQLIAVEPDVFGALRFALFRDGRVWKLESGDVERHLASEGRP